MTGYITYEDADEALEVGLRLVGENRWIPHPHYLNRESERPGKSPTLTPPEVLQVFRYAEGASHANSRKWFFQAEAEVRSADWQGVGFIMWHIEGQFGEPSLVVITTAYRKVVYP